MLLTDSPYPMSDPAAQDLHQRLMYTWDEPAQVRRMLQRAGAPDWTTIDFAQGVRFVWYAVLQQAAAEGTLVTLVQHIVSSEKVAPPLLDHLRALLEGAPTTFDPGGGGIAAPFDDVVPERLLYGDDLTESVGALPGLMDAVERVLARRAAVARVRLGVAGGEASGTGLLVAPTLVLTNHHVAAPGRPVTWARVDFGYELDATGAVRASRSVEADLTPVESSAADDWALVRLREVGPSAPHPLADHRAPVAGERAFILQHPAGREMRLGFVRNRVTDLQHRRLRYLTDTEGGSSGAPVFGGDGLLIGLHRAGGAPVAVPGRAPVRMNEGVRIDVIADAVRAHVGG